MITDLPPTFTTTAARARGVHPRTLTEWRDQSLIVELMPGVFRRTDAPVSRYPALLALRYLVPAEAVVCGLSAAAVHGLIDAAPPVVQVALPHWLVEFDAVPVEAFVFPSASFEVGCADLEVAPGQRVRIYDASRTVVDLIRLRDRVGNDVARAAVARHLRWSADRVELERVAELVEPDVAQWLRESG